ncbi:glycosyl transferase family 3 [Litoreibacter roseus]|uniref:Glycosyl transferase family 3 N-terminal domain-containing protein n=1 Tax=Litoreibacter roseus TaxID=2601869 RepID=A0A6N6JM49_9RHOB|nr:glycosyl transferase family 3 [Litoreibacter roseus]GFE66469.1 hypothetical protein KIN_35430 [Litoreibacter roseus]
MSLAPYIQIVARGKGRARPLTLDEAKAAMALILAGRAEPEAIGALLMVLRLRGEVAEEIAGFAAALREHTRNQSQPADLDWPSYAAGRTRGAPLFFLAARLVADAGYRVSIHGWNSHQADVASLSPVLFLTGGNLRYNPLQTLCPEAFRLLQLRDTFGLRSCINTVLRMWNPTNAPVTVQGVFHPSYRGLQACAAKLLGQKDLTVIKGGGGEFERHPGKDITVFGLRDGMHLQKVAPTLIDETRKLHNANHTIDPVALWHGTHVDEFAIHTVIGTAALALWTLKAAPTILQTQEMARALWTQRHRSESLSA